jgi:trehalose 6-phosphate phosphatase
VSPESGTGERSAGLEPLERLREEPTGTAVLTDVDGTLAPIAERPEHATVPTAASEALRRLSKRYGLVGCVSGRRATEARRLVGVDGIAYAGNHGLELLLPGEDEAELTPGLEGKGDDAARFLGGLDVGELAATGLRTEDKGPIQALHWRGADDGEAAEARAGEVAAAAERRGLAVHWGRKVLELRPAVPIGKDAAIDALLAAPAEAARSSLRPDGGLKVDRAVYAGDDRTDLDAFRRLRELHEQGELEAAVCVGVISDEAPAGLAEASDLTVTGPEGWLAMLESLAG